jgi:hypothetical protein
MTEARSKTRQSPETPVSVTSFDAASATIDPLLQASNRLLAGWMAVNSEILEFGRARLDRSLAIGKALAQSTSIDEAIDLQSQYVRTVVQDYVAESNKIVDLGTRSLLDSMSELRPIAHPHRTEDAAAAE